MRATLGCVSDSVDRCRGSIGCSASDSDELVANRVVMLRFLFSATRVSYLAILGDEEVVAEDSQSQVVIDESQGPPTAALQFDWLQRTRLMDIGLPKTPCSSAFVGVNLVIGMYIYLPPSKSHAANSTSASSLGTPPATLMVAQPVSCCDSCMSWSGDSKFAGRDGARAHMK